MRSIAYNSSHSQAGFFTGCEFRTPERSQAPALNDSLFRNPLYREPATLELLSRIEERDQLRELRRSINSSRFFSRAEPPGGQGRELPDPLVYSAKSDRFSPGHLPPWCFVPTEPATHYQVFRQDVYVCRSFPTVPPPDMARSQRASIFEFSDKSRANLRHVCNNSGHLIKSQFCLTYHEKWPVDGNEVKAHLAAWIKAARRIFPALCYLWVLEFQQRGAPHFHVYLGHDRSETAQKRLARAWTRITGGTEVQSAFHAHPKNWTPWKMEDSSYVMKQYAAKKEQKDVPEQFHNVGRFWGASRNMKPEPLTVQPAAIARFTAPGLAQWDEQGLSRFFTRTLRRYHEKCMNYDRKTGKRRPQKWRTSPLSWGCAEIAGDFRIPFGTKVFTQLMNYVAENGPDEGSYRRWLNAKTPF